MWINLKDDRPAFRYAFVCARRHYQWLMDLFPDDVLQELALACCIEPSPGLPLGRIVSANLFRLMHELGFHSVRRDGSRVFIRDLQPGPRFDNCVRGVTMMTTGHGTVSKYRSGCRCPECLTAKNEAEKTQRRRRKLRDAQALSSI